MMTTGAAANPALRWADMTDEEEGTAVIISIPTTVPRPYRCNRLYVTSMDTFTTHTVVFNASDTVQHLRDQILAKFSILHHNQKITLFKRELMANNNAKIISCNLRDELVVHVSDRSEITVYVKTTDWGTLNLTVPASLTIRILKERIGFSRAPRQKHKDLRTTAGCCRTTAPCRTTTSTTRPSSPCTS